MPDKPAQKKRFCDKPFSTFVLYDAPEYLVHSCCWIFESIGRLGVNATVGEIWNSKEAQKFRRSILDGTFEYCWDQCPHITVGDLPEQEKVEDPYFREIIDKDLTVLPRGPLTVQLNNDRSCNLSCPSCRKETQMLTSGEKFDDMERRFAAFLRDGLKDARELNITGSGDPLASKLYRDFLYSFDGGKRPDLRINLFTNGVLFNEAAWEKMSKIHGNLGSIIVSVDAATEATYQVVRRGGHFEKLAHNLRFLSSLRQQNKIRYLELAFVVQARNYKEMKDFVRLGRDIGNCVVFFQRMWNWGTFTEAEFREHAIFLPGHPQHADFKKRMRDPVFRDPIVDIGNLAEFV